MKKSLGDKLIAMGVSRETLDRLQRFELIFNKWSATINLVAPSTLEDLWERHILDSLQITQIHSNASTWIDLGSGGGFPGIITALHLAEMNDGWIHLVESNNKKAAFLRAALAETGGRGTVHAVRIDAAVSEVPACDCVSARALADLDTLLGYIAPWAKQNPQLKSYLHKGRDYQNELELSRRRWDFDLVKHKSIVEPDSVILEISRIAPKS